LPFTDICCWLLWPYSYLQSANLATERTMHYCSCNWILSSWTTSYSNRGKSMQNKLNCHFCNKIKHEINPVGKTNIRYILHVTHQNKIFPNGGVYAGPNNLHHCPMYGLSSVMKNSRCFWYLLLICCTRFQSHWCKRL